jgi:hypothetical protein
VPGAAGEVDESGPTAPATGNEPGAAGPVPRLSPGEVDESGPTAPATGNEPGAASAVPGLSPGEGAMGEGLPHDLGGPRGDHSRGGNYAT